VIALNELYNPKYFKAWAGQAYLCEMLADVATGKPMPERTLRRGTRGLEKKGIIETKEVRISHNQSKLEYRLSYDKVIGRDAGYPKSRRRGPVEGIQMMLMSDIPPTGHSGPPYRPDLSGLPDQSGRLSSLGNTIGPAAEEKKEERKMESEVERKGESEEETSPVADLPKPMPGWRDRLDEPPLLTGEEQAALGRLKKGAA
jgi:hypothetical protein